MDLAAEFKLQTSSHCYVLVVLSMFYTVKLLYQNTTLLNYFEIYH